MMADSTALQHFLPTLTLSIEAVSILCNLFVIASVIVICKTSSDRLSANHVIAALAVTDILYVVLPAGFSLPSYWSVQWRGGSLTCMMSQLLTEWLVLCSQFMITCLIVERLLALRRVIQFQNQSDDLTQIRVVIVVCYVVSFTISMLPVLGFAPPPYADATRSCSSWLTAHPDPGTHEQRVYPALLITISYLSAVVTLALAVRSISYMRAIKVIYQCIKTDRSNPTASYDDVTSGGSAAHESRDGVDDKSGLVEFTGVIISLNVAHYALRLPYFVWLALYHSGVAQRYVYEMHTYNVLSTSVLVVVRGFLYPLLSADYRQAYKTTCRGLLRLSCCCYVGKISKEFLSHVTDINREASVTALMSNDQTAANDCEDLPATSRRSRQYAQFHANSYHQHSHRNNKHANIKFTSINAQTVEEQSRVPKPLFMQRKSLAKRPTDFGPCFTLMDSASLVNSCADAQGNGEEDPEMSRNGGSGGRGGSSGGDFRGSKLSLISTDSDCSDYGSNSSDQYTKSTAEYRKKNTKVFCLEESVI